MKPYSRYANIDIERHGEYVGDMINLNLRAYEHVFELKNSRTCKD